MYEAQVGEMIVNPVHELYCVLKRESGVQDCLSTLSRKLPEVSGDFRTFVQERTNPPVGIRGKPFSSVCSLQIIVPINIIIVVIM